VLAFLNFTCPERKIILGPNQGCIIFRAGKILFQLHKKLFWLENLFLKTGRGRRDFIDLNLDHCGRLTEIKLRNQIQCAHGI
tara:strand:- start:250 stop:495 length:246 start_codon:yes stop_codon:yes gene_type:complete